LASLREIAQQIGLTQRRQGAKGNPKLASNVHTPARGLIASDPGFAYARVVKRYVLLTAVVLAAVIPFSSRAVFMDEHIFLQIARSAQTQWLFPQDTSGMFFGTAVPNFAAHTHPPVGEYVLALAYALLGRFDEVSFRLLFAVFPIMAVLAFYRLATRFVSDPFWVTLLFAVSPAFFVYAPTLMMDVPMLAFLLTGFMLYFDYVDGRRWALPLASISLSLALGSGYTAMIPLACLAISIWLARRPARELFACGVPVVVLGVWLTGMSIHFGGFPLVATARFFLSQGSMFWNLVAVFTFLGGVTVFPLAATGKRMYIVGSALALASAQLLLPAATRPLWVALFAVSGMVMVGAFIRSARSLMAGGVNRGEAFLLLWAPATLVFFVVVGDMINTRYILLATPALFLVMFRDATRARLVSMLVPTVLLSAALAWADFKFVNSNREFVHEVVAPLQSQGFRISAAAESGLRFYLEQRGIPSLYSTDDSSKAGDLIVRHAGFPFRYPLAAEVEKGLKVRQTFILNSAFPVRTFSARSRAGFHDSRLGLAPFTLSTEPFDGVVIEEVGAIAESKAAELSQTKQR
jgi:hypothetical protein